MTEGRPDGVHLLTLILAISIAGLALAYVIGRLP